MTAPAALMALALAALAAATPAGGAAPTAQGRSRALQGTNCVHLDESQTQLWLDRETTAFFSLRYQIDEYVPFTHITLMWPSPVLIDHVYEADIAEGPKDNEESDKLVVSLSAQRHETRSFQVMGRGAQEPPSAYCMPGNEWEVAPSPSPPGTKEPCDLQPTYQVKQKWDGGEYVQVSFGTWETGRYVHLWYWGQTDLQARTRARSGRALPSPRAAPCRLTAFARRARAMQVVRPIHAGVASIGIEEGGTMVVLALGEACTLGEKLTLEEEGKETNHMNCVPTTADPRQQSLVAFEIRPNPRHPPRIVCHEEPPPSPPPPPPPTPPPPRAPPPRPGAPPPDAAHTPPVVANDACELGGAAKIVFSRNFGGHDNLRVEVAPAKPWRAGVLYSVGVAGADIDVTHVAHADLQPDVEVKTATGKPLVVFSFRREWSELQGGGAAPPPDKFAFTVEGQRPVVVSLTCTSLGDPPPAPPVGEAAADDGDGYESYYSYDDEGGEGGGDDGARVKPLDSLLRPGKRAPPPPPPSGGSVPTAVLVVLAVIVVLAAGGWLVYTQRRQIAILEQQVGATKAGRKVRKQVRDAKEALGGKRGRRARRDDDDDEVEVNGGELSLAAEEGESDDEQTPSMVGEKV